MRGGDLGSLPVVIGLVLIWAIFQILNPNFLSADNLVNLTLQCAATGTIAIGVVLVLLVAQIDLSIGSISGLAAAILGVGMTQLGWPIWLAIVAAIAAGAFIGLIYGLLFTKFGVPTFVITLAGLLAFLGLQLQVLGPNGSINLPYDSWIVQFAQSWFLPPWAGYTLAALAAAGMFGSDWFRARRRANAGLSSGSVSVMLLKSVVLLVLMVASVAYLATNRGVGVMFLTFVVLVVVTNFFLVRTRWGRAVYAVGGNVEAARRAGIKVNSIFISVLVLGTTFAAVGGLFASARLTSASLSSGGGDTNLLAIAAAVIGGTAVIRRTRQRLLRAARHPRHPVDLERSDLAEPRFAGALHDHRRRAAGRGHHRLAVAAFPRQSRAGLAGCSALTRTLCTFPAAGSNNNSQVN